MLGMAPGMVGRIGKPSRKKGAAIAGGVSAPTVLDFSSTAPGVLTYSRAGAGATYFDNTGTLQMAAANTGRIDWGPTPGSNALGILIEEARANLIRNPRAEGATSASPGVLPTNWSANGATQTTVVSTSAEAGIPYVGVRFSGGSGLTANVAFEDITTAAVTPGQTVSGSFYIRLSGGAVTNTTFTIALSYYNSGAFLSQQLVTFVPTSAGLATQRTVIENQTVPATATHVTLNFRYVTTGAYDFTVRMAGPQIELGAASTSLILPAVSVPLSTTRNADIVSYPTGAWFSATAGTLEVLGTPRAIASASVQYAFAALESNSSNTFTLRTTLSTTQGQVAIYTANVFQAFTPTGTLVAGSENSMIASYAAAGGGFSCNGSAVTTYGAITVPTMTALNVGTGARNVVLNGWVRRIRYWNRVLTSAELLSPPS